MRRRGAARLRVREAAIECTAFTMSVSAPSVKTALSILGTPFSVGQVAFTVQMRPAQEIRGTREVPCPGGAERLTVSGLGGRGDANSLQGRRCVREPSPRGWRARLALIPGRVP